MTEIAMPLFVVLAILSYFLIRSREAAGILITVFFLTGFTSAYTPAAWFVEKPVMWTYELFAG